MNTRILALTVASAALLGLAACNNNADADKRRDRRRPGRRPWPRPPPIRSSAAPR